MLRNFGTLILKPISILGLAILIVLMTSSIFGQNATPPSIIEIIAKAAAQRAIYLEEFKNLISKETKTFEMFDKKGQVKKRRSITSVFIVYQTSKSNEAVEFRNIVAVDGKDITNTDKRAEQFFEQVIGAQSSDKELQKLRDESSRFDEEISIDGLTLFQAVALADNLRPFFEFRHIGNEQLEGRDTIVLSYEQTRASPFILTGNSANPAGANLTLRYDIDISGEANHRLKGKLWLDAATMQVRREIRQLMVRPERFSAPVIYSEQEFHYGQSDFPLLPPTRIVHTQNELKMKDMTAIREARVVFEYETFTRPDVNVESSDVK